MDAYDMSAHIAEVTADLWADAMEDEDRFAQYRATGSNCSRADWDASGRRAPSEEAAHLGNSEIDAALDRFVAENPKLRQHYEGLSKDELIRELMLSEMQQRECAEMRDQQIRPWLDENPEVAARVEERVRHGPAANRERAFGSAAKQEATNQTVRGGSIRT